MDEAARLLVVEDDFLVAAALESGLGEAGFRVVGVATTAEEAVALAGEHRPALVIMDIRLAGRRDGIDAALEIFRLTGIRCIFASAQHDDGARRRAEPAAPLGWLPKPYTLDSVVAMTRKALASLAGGR